MSEYCREDTVKISVEKLQSFINRHQFFILTTHDPADADGVGAQMVLACILRERGKRFRIINASPLQEHFRFMDPQGLVEQWDGEKHGALAETGGMIMIDTAYLNNIGQMSDPVRRAGEVFVIDHHEITADSAFAGIRDATASSTCEIAVELAGAMNVRLDTAASVAAYTGIVFDSGSFSYQKTSLRTFHAALPLIENGVNPNKVYQLLCENASIKALLLQKKAIASLAIHCKGQVVSQVLRAEDFAETGALNDDTDGLVNNPLRVRELVISLLVKEIEPGKVRCSLRSKHAYDVSKIANAFGGGGHINAAGFTSKAGVEQTLAQTLAAIGQLLDTP